MGFTGSYWVNIDFIGYYSVLLAFIRFFMGFTGFYWVFPLDTIEFS